MFCTVSVHVRIRQNGQETHHNKASAGPDAVQFWTMHSQDVTKRTGTHRLRRGGASVGLPLGAALG